MIQYYGYTISPNQIETGEGFLICRNVPISRTGDQEYLGWEIGIPGAGGGQIVTVHRPPEEVFSTAALASFEGKPVTNDHPPVLIGPDDVKTYEMGHAQNVRRGDGEWEEYTLADLHIHDRELIDAVQSGKREISCGYECEYVPNGDGTYTQRNIRGNHVAVVERGRAGKRAAILDSDKKKAKEPERKGNMNKKGLFFKLFGQAVKDKSPEEIEQMAMDAAAALEAEKPADGQAEGQKEEPAKETASDEAVIDAIAEKILAKLEEKGACKKKEETKDALDAALEKLTEGGDPGQAGETEKTSGDTEKETRTGTGMDRSTAAGILKAMRPAVAAIKDEKERLAVSDALIRLVMAEDSQDDISAILKASQANGKKAAVNTVTVDTDAIQDAYDAMNPHRGRKETK
ncbi:DUF2213 domain-containing protein [Alitiscatomonas sp.]|uniref:DUF2213 domain-containing protein n=1 Tax=Alitiscatomonas sp. TaxID=2981647 RepID=UPI003076D2F0